MDEQVSAMLAYFDLSEAGFAWRGARPAEIEHRRAAMSDALLFDVLLQHGGIRDPYALYPPHDAASLSSLLAAIAGSSYDALKADCLVYFLLKWHGDGREAGFADALALPPHFLALTDAYWHLDAGVDVGRAVRLLADARVNREHAGKVLEALAPHPRELVRYVRVAQPVLAAPADAAAYARALAHADVRAAWAFARTLPAPEPVLHAIISAVFAPVNPEQIEVIAAMPFTPAEQRAAEALALAPTSTSKLPGPARSLLADLLITRHIQAGALSAAVLLDARLAAAGPASAARRGMMEDVRAVLPPVERLVLDDLPPPPAAQTNGDVSMSWEEIPRPAAKGKDKEPPKEPASAPRPGLGTPRQSQNVPISGRKPSSRIPVLTPGSGAAAPFGAPGAASPFGVPRPPSAQKPASLQDSDGEVEGNPFAPSPAASGAFNTGGSAPRITVSTPFATGSAPKFPGAGSIFPTPSASASARAPRLSFNSTPSAFTPGGSAGKPKPTPAPFKATRAVSAARAPNAFFNPPPAAPAEEARATPDEIDGFLSGREEEGAEDKEMFSEAEEEREEDGVSQVSEQSEPEPEQEQEGEEEEEEEPPQPTPRPTRGSRRSAAARAPTHARAHEPPSPSTSPPPAKRTTRTRARARVPGAFADTTDEEPDEPDAVPELAFASPVKGRRSTRAGGAAEPVRRSSRLSVVSASPEPRSPVKRAGAGRKKAGAAGGGRDGGEGSAGKGKGTRRR